MSSKLLVAFAAFFLSFSGSYFIFIIQVSNFKLIKNFDLSGASPLSPTHQSRLLSLPSPIIKMIQWKRQQ
jgi:hypothetical protein